MKLSGRNHSECLGIAEHSLTLRFDAQHGKIIGRYQLSENPLRLCAHTARQADIKRDAILQGGHAAHQFLLLPILLDVVVRHPSAKPSDLISARDAYRMSCRISLKYSIGRRIAISAISQNSPATPCLCAMLRTTSSPSCMTSTPYAIFYSVRKARA